MNNRPIALLFPTLLLLLAACGNKGDLYLPDEPPEQSDELPQGEQSPELLGQPSGQQPGQTPAPTPARAS